MTDISKHISGTGVALVTPFNKKGFVDYDALKKLIHYLIDGGVDYLVSLGTTGETPTLSKAEKTDILKFTVHTVKNHSKPKMPVIAGIGGNNTKEVIEELHSFPLESITAILSTSPYYNKPSQEGLFQHYKSVAENSPKPVIVYNVPGRSGKNVEAKTTVRLAHEVRNIAGIKEASGDIIQCMRILREAPAEFTVVSGDDALAFPQIAMGMKGVISVAANAFPAQFSRMVDATLKSDLQEAKKINDRLMPVYDLMFAENNPAGVKAFLAELGLIKNYLRLPLVNLSSHLAQQVKPLIKETADIVNAKA